VTVEFITTYKTISNMYMQVWSIKLDPFLSLTGSWSWAIEKSERGSSRCH